MNKYMVRASLMLIGNVMLWAFAAFLLYHLIRLAPVEFVLGIFFFIAAVSTVTFISVLISAAKDYVIGKARKLARKDGIHV